MDSNFLKNLSEFDDHRAVTNLNDAESGLRGFIAIHRGGIRRPAFGATRLWSYNNETEAIKAALRLSRMMSYKSALAGLKYGGAKGVIMWDKKNGKHRRKILRAYARSVNYLNGNFVTGTDVGITTKDIKVMKKESPYFVGLRVDPTYYTSLGMLYSIQTCFKKMFGKEDISGKSFAIKGVGKVGSGFLDLIYKDAGNIYIADIDIKRVCSIQKKYPRVKISSIETIHKKKVDVFSPCALGLSLNKKIVPELKSKIISGGENNQLEEIWVGEKLYKMGILYAPDYVVNAGGLISVVDEYEHKSDNKKRIVRKVSGIKNRLKKIFNESEKRSKATNIVANEIAEKTFNNYK